MNKKVKTFNFPPPDKFKINEANFELKLGKFEKKLKNEFSFDDVFRLVPMVIFYPPVNSFWFLSTQQMEIVYFGYCIFMVFTLVNKVFNNIPRKNNPKNFIEDLKKSSKEHGE
ncbi:MAG: hypothetical protein A3D44_03180 [Candidatus Staskawiczbacteria bacterium RIFCSPHIGHO2_02_FULL_42_22]|uniref:Uncharacterized protein n=1 Tax=Candidatus Staskawiczbacteria bacterium RIFCSPHIGHO2_02_FULL_42_22 TaxID=1802207 RepID=A0A1G2I4Z0_9BACT|nr:MAG: hypothetical protein A3D44_03180 [Candidatus Staskawiczbacteria bacterium RIFCSPHIGHO2_02_FULL_42_22]